MRKVLHYFAMVAFMAAFVMPANAQLTLKIIKTGEDGGVDISYDDGEYENDAIDKLYDDDLDMGWEGEDLNVMTTFLRFQNVTIPQGTTIDSAFLYLYAHEDEVDPAYINIYAEDIDDSPSFTEDEMINDRTWTSAMLEWDITEPWTMWEPYRSPDLASVVQAVINRSGWQSGNSLTLFFQGEDQGASLLDNARDFESFENIEDPEDGGDGLHHPERVPMLKIYYTASQELTFNIVKTGEDGGVDISYDDGEYENDAIDKLYDDDLDMGWEGEDLNVMTAFTRFQNVSIPQGTEIDSAYVIIYAHEDEVDEARINVYAEDIAYSPRFTEDEMLDDRTWTSEMVEWNITEEWTMWEPYRSPDLSNIIEAVVGRDDWESGNALTLFFQGEDQGASLLDNARDFESFENIEDPEDGGDGLHHPERVPVLKVFYKGALGEEKGYEEITSVRTYKAIEAKELEVYPNPTEGNITLHFESYDQTDVKLYDIRGKLIRSFNTFSSEYQLNISDLPQGIYIIEAFQKDNLYIQKVSKK